MATASRFHIPSKRSHSNNNNNDDDIQDPPEETPPNVNVQAKRPKISLSAQLQGWFSKTNNFDSKLQRLSEKIRKQSHPTTTTKPSHNSNDEQENVDPIETILCEQPQKMENTNTSILIQEKEEYYQCSTEEEEEEEEGEGEEKEEEEKQDQVDDNYECDTEPEDDQIYDEEPAQSLPLCSPDPAELEPFEEPCLGTSPKRSSSKISLSDKLESSLLQDSDSDFIGISSFFLSFFLFFFKL
jgi:hypothetical protein